MATQDAPTKRCPECRGQGGTFTDEWGSGGHFTKDRACENCDGTGEVERRCDCGGPAEHHNDASPGDWLCTACKAEVDADDRQAPVASVQLPARDRIPTARDGVPVTMRQLVWGAGL